MTSAEHTPVNAGSWAETLELTDLLREMSTETNPPALLGRFGTWFGRKRPADFFATVSRRGLPDGQYKITRRMTDLERRNPEAPAPNPWRDWATLPTYEGGFLGELMKNDRPQLVRGIEVRGDLALGDDIAEMRSVMALPNFDGGKAINWAFFFLHDPDGWTLDLLQDTMLVSNLLGTATRSLVAERRLSEANARVTGQLEQIARIQRSLLPRKVPDVPGLDISVSYLTSNEAGGDYYDFFALPGDEWGILIADVSGHGAGAATIMAMLRAILHCYEDHDTSPWAIMRYANAKLVESHLDGNFVTAFFAVWNPERREIRWIRCGHNPPRLKTARGVQELLDDGTLPLGLSEDFPRSEASFRLDPGDTLVLYTDGITEAFGPSEPGGIRPMFGVERLDEALEHCSGKPGCVVDSVHAALYKFTGVMARDDDQTLVALRAIEPAVESVAAG